MASIENKFNGLTQEQIDQVFNSGVKWAALLRTAAVIFLILVGLWTFYLSVFTNKKFFHENNSLVKAIKDYEYIK